MRLRCLFLNTSAMMPEQARRSSIVSNSGTRFTRARISRSTSPTSLSSTASSSRSDTDSAIEMMAVWMIL